MNSPISNTNNDKNIIFIKITFLLLLLFDSKIKEKVIQVSRLIMKGGYRMISMNDKVAIDLNNFLETDETLGFMHNNLSNHILITYRVWFY